MKAVLIVMGVVAVAATVKYGPGLYDKGVMEYRQLMTKVSKPFDDRKADVRKLNKITTPTGNGTNTAGGGVKQSANDILKQMKKQKKELRNK